MKNRIGIWLVHLGIAWAHKLPGGNTGSAWGYRGTAPRRYAIAMALMRAGNALRRA